MDFIALREGPVLPIEAIELAIDLESRGVRLQRSAEKLMVVCDDGRPVLSDDERSTIRQFKGHLLELVSYCEKER